MDRPVINWTQADLQQVLQAIAPSYPHNQDPSLTSLIVLQCLWEHDWPGVSVYRRAVREDGTIRASIPMFEQDGTRLDVFGCEFERAKRNRRWHTVGSNDIVWDEFYPSTNDSYLRSVAAANIATVKSVRQALDDYAIDLVASALEQSISVHESSGSKLRPRL